MSNGPNVNLLLCARPKAGAENGFARWSQSVQAAVLAHPGTVSCEFWPPAPPDQDEWVAILRFDSVDSQRAWRGSETFRRLLEDVEPFVEGDRVVTLSGGAATELVVHGSATEFIVTVVKPGKEAEFRDWAARIDDLESTFSGYRGSYIQPSESGDNVWTTLVRFDSVENLNAWLQSPQRKKVLKEGEGLVERFLAHRVDTSFPGWVPPDPVTGKPPNMWKTASLVLLVLFPVVMLELKFLMPHLHSLDPALATFVGNAISVLLTTWPLMPLAIWLFRAYLFPEKQPKWLVAASPALLAACYAIELAIFWRLL
ncbi:MAG TPA: antibiotic biosynthesis monooxygenase [Candidatus Baltobacteraceae bacterium]|nr:antibiotic biosynthesis monooxygenase [Candidatus Baltobacteraceae bacterium]